MIYIKKKIERVITGDNKNGYGWFVPFLSMASKVYGGAVKLRRMSYEQGLLKSKRLSCLVISIGNITVGGTGKTPMTIYVAQVIKQLGYKVVIVSRGYRGKAEKLGGIASDGKGLMMTAEVAGDEPYMMAKRLHDVPVIVGKNRFNSGGLAIQNFNPDVILLDDGFQHLMLQRDLDIVLLDNHNPFGNGHLLPRGGMREPALALLNADAIILTRSETKKNNEISSSSKKFLSHKRRIPVYRTFHHPFVYKITRKAKNVQEEERQSLDCIKGRSVFAFSGLADNHSFQQTVKSLKCNVSGFMEFPDHHPYSSLDLKNIWTAAKKNLSDCILTTEKDYVRIAHKIDWHDDLFVIGIEIDFGEDTKRFDTFIERWIVSRYRSNEHAGLGKK